MSPQFEYRRNARKSPMFYAILTLGLFFTISGIIIDPVKHCVEYPCPIWLRALASGMGILFAGGASIAVIRGFQYGSHVDVAQRMLYWWEGIPPVQKQSIPVDEIRWIQIDTAAEDSLLLLLDANGERIPLSNRCIPFPFEKWAHHLKLAFPHIEILEK